MPPKSPTRVAALALAVAAALVATSAPAHAAAGRGYELVSFPTAATNVGLGSLLVPGTLTPHWSPVTSTGSVLLGSNTPVVGEPSGVASSQWVATRGATGWSRTYVGMPPRRNALDGAQSPLTFSADLRSSAWWTQSAVGADPIDPSPIVTASPYVIFYSLLLRTPGGTTAEQLVGGTTAPGPFSTSANAELSADGSTLTFAATGLTLPPATAPVQVYQRAGGAPRLLGYDAHGQELTSAFLVATDATGGRVLMSGVDADGNSGLYLWSGGAATTAIPVGPSGAAVAVDAGLRTVTVITRERLSAADTDDSADLYDVDTATGAATLLTKGDTSGGDTSDPTTCGAPLPQSQVIGGAGDCDVAFYKGRPGEITYFESPEILDDAPGAVLGEPNVYYARGGHVHFAFHLDPAGASSGFDTILQAGPRFTVDSSGAVDFTAPTTADPDRDTGGLSQAQRFDPATGRVTCLSCAPPGAATTATGELQPQQRGFPVSSGTDVTADGDLVYFTTAQPLSSADTNRTSDVYEFDARTGARTLISPGSQDTDALFAGVSADGTDVFFATQQTLVSADQNGAVWKIYDARRGGGFPEPVPASPCQGDACRPPAAAPPAASTIAASPPGPPNVADPDGNDSVLTLATPTKSSLRSLVRTGKLRVKITGAAVGERLHLRLDIGKTRYASTDTTAGKGGATATLRLTSARRRALAKLARRKAVAATLTVASQRSSAGDDASLTLPKTSGSTR
jgi:hypothetical protein